MNRPTMLLVPLAATLLFLTAAPAAAVYHPTLGRFLQRDPIRYVDGMNLYGYGRHKPADHRDPDGLQYIADAQFCCCLEIEVTFPDELEWRSLGHKGGHFRYGFEMVVEFEIWGNPAKCTFRQDETGNVTSSGGKVTRDAVTADGEELKAGSTFRDQKRLGPNKIEAGDLASGEGGRYRYRDTPHGVYPSYVKGEVTMEMDFEVNVSCTGTDGWTISRTFSVSGSQKAHRPGSAGTVDPKEPTLLPPTNNLQISPRPPRRDMRHPVISP